MKIKVIIWFFYFAIITFCRGLNNDIILEFIKDGFDFSIENEIKQIFKENNLEILKFSLITTKSNRSYIITKINIPHPLKNLNKIKETLKNKINGFNSIVENKIYDDKASNTIDLRRRLDFLKDQDEDNSKLFLKYMSAKYKFWENGIKGKNVKVGIFDSGVSNEFSKCNVKENNNFSQENEKDLNGHGTHITSLICNDNYGISPEVNIYMYKVFDKHRRTNTSWLIQAMEKAQEDKLDILNFSFGGINFNDRIISDKIEELVSDGIIIVTSAGNDGPSYGTINFPGNLPFVITVGATNEDVFTISEISSRGPAILKKNLLINKPNTWAPGVKIPSLDKNGSVQYRSGSSISTAIVTGYLSLLLSKFYDERKLFNIGNLLLIIKESNINLPGINFQEIPSGLFNPDGLLKITEFYIKNKERMKSYILNDVIDFSCNFYSNFKFSEEYKEKHRIFVYSTMQPIYFSLMFVNPNSNSMNKINLNYEIDDENRNSTSLQNCVNLRDMKKDIDNDYLIFNNQIGVLHMEISVLKDAKCRFLTGSIDWNIYFTDELNENKIGFKLMFDIIPTPSRYNRILIDRFHNLFYPFDGYIAKDDLLDNSYNFDWNYESLSTNYFNLFVHLKSSEYFVEELNESLECIDMSEYSVLIFLDLEKSLSEKEINRLRYEYEEKHLSIFIITEWNDSFFKDKITIYDDETLDYVNPISFGAESYSFNKFLLEYGIQLGNDAISNEFDLQSEKLKLKSANSISEFPATSYLYGNDFKNDKYLMDITQEKSMVKAVLGLIDQLPDKLNSGRMVVFTDSYCVDDYQMKNNVKEDNCFWLISSILKFLIHGQFIKNDINISEHILSDLDFQDRLAIHSNQDEGIIQQINETYLCPNENYSAKFIIPIDYTPFNRVPTEKKTSEITNLINGNTFKFHTKNEKNLDFLEVIENILFVVVPIISIIFILGIIVRCKRNNITRIRLTTNLSNLKTTRSFVELDQLNNSTTSSTKITNSLVIADNF